MNTHEVIVILLKLSQHWPRAWNQTMTWTDTKRGHLCLIAYMGNNELNSWHTCCNSVQYMYNIAMHLFIKWPHCNIHFIVFMGKFEVLLFFYDATQAYSMYKSFWDNFPTYNSQYNNIHFSPINITLLYLCTYFPSNLWQYNSIWLTSISIYMWPHRHILK